MNFILKMFDCCWSEIPLFIYRNFEFSLLLLVRFKLLRILVTSICITSQNLSNRSYSLPETIWHFFFWKMSKDQKVFNLVTWELVRVKLDNQYTKYSKFKISVLYKMFSEWRQWEWQFCEFEVLIKDFTKKRRGWRQ